MNVMPQGSQSMNPNLAVFAQMAQPQTQPQPPMPPGAPPQLAPQMQPAMNPPVPSQMAAPSSQFQGMQGTQMQNSRFTPQEQAELGKFGDTIVAHLTPGEIAIPPQMQTPKVLAVLNQEFAKNNVSPSQFTAGSPQASVNPDTGMAQFNFLSAFLPTILGLAGTAFAPELGIPAFLGGGLGSAAGGLISGQDPMQAVLGGVGSAAGGYLGGQLTPAASSAGTAAAAKSAASAIPSTPTIGAGDPFGVAGAAGNAGQLAAGTAGNMSAPSASNLWGMLPGNVNWGESIGSALGSQIGQELGKPTPKYKPKMPPGFEGKFPSMSEIPNYNESLGTTSYTGPTPKFDGYNPMTLYSNAYDFFPNA